jgi:nitrous oxidase accessory protein NosD
VIGNTLRNGGPSSAGVYLVRVNGFEVADNRIEGTSYGVVLDGAADGAVASNVIVAAGPHRVRGIGLVADIGNIVSVRITGNESVGFEDGVVLEGQRGRLQRIEIDSNNFRNGTRGIRVTSGASNVIITRNTARGNRSLDLEVRGGGVTVGANDIGSRNELP